MNIENNIFVITDVCLYRIMHFSLKNAGMCVISSAHFGASPLEHNLVAKTSSQKQGTRQPHHYLNHNGKKRTSRTYTYCPSAASDIHFLSEPANEPA